MPPGKGVAITKTKMGTMKLFILHGWTYTPKETWAPLLIMLKERGVDFEFLPIPGLADGTNPVWALEDYVEWLRRKTEGQETFALYGHSNGGRISIAFAVKYPENVRALILEDSAGIPSRGLRALKRDIFRRISHAFHFLTRSETLRRIVYKLIRENDYRDATPEMRTTMANLVSVDLGKVLDRIVCPTLIIWGRNDTTTPLWIGEVIHKGIRHSRMKIFEDARHSPHVTHAREVAELVAKELQNL